MIHEGYQVTVLSAFTAFETAAWLSGDVTADFAHGLNPVLPRREIACGSPAVVVAVVVRLLAPSLGGNGDGRDERQGAPAVVEPELGPPLLEHRVLFAPLGFPCPRGCYRLRRCGPKLCSSLPSLTW